MERFAHTVVELVVDNGAPVFWFLISHRLNIYKKETPTVNHGVRPGLPKTETVLENWLGIMEKQLLLQCI